MPPTKGKWRWNGRCLLLAENVLYKDKGVLTVYLQEPSDQRWFVKAQRNFKENTESQQMDSHCMKKPGEQRPQLGTQHHQIWEGKQSGPWLLLRWENTKELQVAAQRQAMLNHLCMSLALKSPTSLPYVSCEFMALSTTKGPWPLPSGLRLRSAALYQT